MYSEVLKTLEVVSKMAFLVFEKCKFPRIFCRIPARTQFSEIILKIYLTKRKNAFEKLNHINFVTWAVTENPNFRVLVISLAFKKIELLNYGSELLFANCAEVVNYVPQNWGTSKNFEKVGKWSKIAILNPSKISAVHRCFRGNQCSSALNQRCFRENQRWNSADS